MQLNKDTHKMANTHLFIDTIFLMIFTVIWCRLLICGSESPNFACSAYTSSSERFPKITE